MTVNIITYVFKHPFEYLSTISMLKKKKKKAKTKQQQNKTLFSKEEKIKTSKLYYHDLYGLNIEYMRMFLFSILLS